MKRIMIIGASGSGKSTLARNLGVRLGLPVTHIDRFYFAPGWVQRPREETDALACAAADADEWVFEGNNSSTFDYRAERSDLIVVLDPRRLRRLLRCLWRTARYYGRNRPDMAKGCPERFEWAFLFDWVWNYDTHSRHKAEALVERWQDRRPILRLRSVRAVNRFARDPQGYLRHVGATLPIAPPTAGG